MHALLILCKILTTMIPIHSFDIKQQDILQEIVNLERQAQESKMLIQTTKYRLKEYLEEIDRLPESPYSYI